VKKKRNRFFWLCLAVMGILFGLSAISAYIAVTAAYELKQVLGMVLLFAVFTLMLYWLFIKKKDKP